MTSRSPLIGVAAADGAEWNVRGLAKKDPPETLMSKRKVKSRRHSNRTPWQEAAREVPSAWLEGEARKSPSPYSLLASWKGPRGGVPSHVMIKLLRRRLRESYPELKKTTFPPARLQRAQDMLKQICARVGRAGERHPSWRLVEGLLWLAAQSLGD